MPRVERDVPIGPELPATKPLADAARRFTLKLPAPISAQMVARQERRAAREQALRVQEQARREREQAQREQRRLDDERFWAEHEARIAWRPPPVENPVYEPPGVNIFSRILVHGYGTRIRQTRFP